MKNNGMKTKTASFEAQPGEVKKAVLLYSGGLDTSVMVKWIQDHYKAEVITVTIDLGQPGVDLAAVAKKAEKMGAEKAYVINAKQEFAEGYVAKAIKANALYQGKYPLSTAIGRPLLVKKAIEIAEKENADCIAHGSTGKGNDQVRFDCGIISLAPDLKIIAPVREWGMSRDEEIKYAEEHGIDVPTTIENPYSTDENLWGKSSECGVLEDPSIEPPKEVFNFVTLPELAPDIPEYVLLGFEKGVPVALNGKKMPLHELIIKLNDISAKHGVGIIDHMEDRVVGLKSREIYECPAATCILEAHKDLEKFVSTSHENQFKEIVDQKWAYMAYSGMWFDPLMDSLNAFTDKMNEKATGTVKLKLFKGNCIVVSRKSDYAIYDFKLATYDWGSLFNQGAAPGFIELWSLQSKVANQAKKGVQNEVVAEKSIAQQKG